MGVEDSAVGHRETASVRPQQVQPLAVVKNREKKKGG
jgi:hypothetical protein